MHSKQCKMFAVTVMLSIPTKIKSNLVPRPHSPRSFLKMSMRIVLVALSSFHDGTKVWGLCSPGGGEQGSTWLLIHARSSHHLSATWCPCEAVRALQDHWVHREAGHSQVHYTDSHQAVKDVMLSAQSPQAPGNRLQTRILASPGGVPGEHRGLPPYIAQPHHPNKQNTTSDKSSLPPIAQVYIPFLFGKVHPNPLY